MASADPQPVDSADRTATGPTAAGPAPRASRLFALRREIPRWQAMLWALTTIGLVGAVWYALTAGEPEQRIVRPGVLPSPEETFASFHSLWFDRALTRNTLVSLRRVVLGFGLAALVGVPLGVLCGCYPWINACFAPVTIFGRNIPVAALIPLTFSFFGIGELQKVMFLFIACVAFVIFDTARAVNDVSSRYIDTAYTLGANRRQIIGKVLVPLALPGIFNSLRLLFGLAFGYIMLTELISLEGSSGGLGQIINISQRLGVRTHILLVLLIIPAVALAIDRLLFWMQRELFPHQYGGSGVLHQGVRALSSGWEAVRGVFIKPTEFVPSNLGQRSTAQGRTSVHKP